MSVTLKTKGEARCRVTDTGFRIEQTNLAENLAETWREITVDDRRKVQGYFGEGGWISYPFVPDLCLLSLLL